MIQEIQIDDDKYLKIIGKKIIVSLWHKIQSIFYIDCENYEVMAHLNLNHLSLALISQIIYNRIKLDPKEEKKYRSDNKFIASHITYLINRETNINNQIFLKTLLDNLNQKISILKVNNMHLDIKALDKITVVDNALYSW